MTVSLHPFVAETVVPVYRAPSFHRETTKRQRLWELTVKTLPYLINLKVLVMTQQFTPGPTLLQSSDFQLQLLQYQASKNHDNLLSVVLPMQRDLLHLSIYSHFHKVLPLLTHSESLASLISLECDIPLFAKLAHTRKIVAFAVTGVTPYQTGRLVMDENDGRACRDAFMRLKYLKMDAKLRPEWLQRLNRILDGSQLRITILELNDHLLTDVSGALFLIPTILMTIIQSTMRNRSR